MNDEIVRLLGNLRLIVDANGLEAELTACAQDKSIEVVTIEDLNEYLEESMTYWEE